MFSSVKNTDDVAQDYHLVTLGVTTPGAQQLPQVAQCALPLERATITVAFYGI